MPKKFVGENTKATAAKAAKAAKLKGEQERIEKEKEDAYWADDDKNVLKKQQRKEEKERKEAELRARKQELKVLADAELTKAAGSGKQMQAESSGAAKVTQHQLDKRREVLEQQVKEEEHRRQLARKKIVVVGDEDLLSENVNRLGVDGQSAKTVEEALDMLKGDTTADDVDRHPEKRLRATYTAFEDQRIEALKKEWPTLRISQLRQMVGNVGFELKAWEFSKKRHFKKI